MTFWWLGLCALAGSLFAAGLPPASATAPRPVARDAACAAALSSRVAAGGPVQVLGCDPRGRGLAVVALGDPSTAQHVAILVPGSDIDLKTLDDPAQPQRRPLGWARALHDAVGRDTAIVLWVGYLTPRGIGIDAASGRLAHAGAAALTTFVDELRAEHVGSPPHLTVIGHSYGAVVVAIAAPQLSVDDIVLLGSPGARARSVTQLDTAAQVWAARTAGDWTRLIPNVRIGDLGHGTDPTAPGFGAHLLPIDGTWGHDGYFRQGSVALAALASVAAQSSRPPSAGILASGIRR